MHFQVPTDLEGSCRVCGVNTTFASPVSLLMVRIQFKASFDCFWNIDQQLLKLESSGVSIPVKNASVRFFTQDRACLSRSLFGESLFLMFTWQAMFNWGNFCKYSVQLLSSLYILFCFFIFIYLIFLFYFILFYFILFYFVLFCFILFYFVLFCFALFCFVLFYFIFYYFIWFCAIWSYFIFSYFIIISFFYNIII